MTRKKNIRVVYKSLCSWALAFKKYLGKEMKLEPILGSMNGCRTSLVYVKVGIGILI